MLDGPQRELGYQDIQYTVAVHVYIHIYIYTHVHIYTHRFDPIDVHIQAHNSIPFCSFLIQAFIVVVLAFGVPSP